MYLDVLRFGYASVMQLYSSSIQRRQSRIMQTLSHALDLLKLSYMAAWMGTDHLYSSMLSKDQMHLKSQGLNLLMTDFLASHQTSRCTHVCMADQVPCILSP